MRAEPPGRGDGGGGGGVLGNGGMGEEQRNGGDGQGEGGYRDEVQRRPAGIGGQGGLGRIPQSPPPTPPLCRSRLFRGGLPLSKPRGTAAQDWEMGWGEGSEAASPETVTG